MRHRLPARQVGPPSSAAGPDVWVLVATIAGSAMAFIDANVVNVALPVLQVDLGATTAGAQWVVAAYMLFLGSLLLIGGALGDRLGRRRVFVAGTTIFTLASVGCGLAPNLTILVGARAVQGVGAAMLVPGSLSIITAYFPAERRGRAIGTWSGFSAITTAFGPVLGGWLIQTASWRAIFFLNVPLAVLVVAVSLRWIPESRDGEATGSIDWLGGGLATVGLGCLVLGLINGAALASGPLVWGPVAIGAILLGTFWLVEHRVRAPMMAPELFQSRTFVGVNILTILLYGALGGTIFFVPFNLIRVHGFSALQAGAALLPYTILLFALSRRAGSLADRYGARLPLIVGPTLAAAGFALFALPGTGGSYWATFFPAVVVLGLGMSTTVAPLTTVVMNSAGRHNTGAASGINNTAARVAGLLAIAVFGILAVQVFSHSFDDGLTHLPLPAYQRATLHAQRDRLVGIQLPSSLGQTDRARVRHVIDDAFVTAFRAVMLLGAALGLAGAATAAIAVEPRPRLRDTASRHGIRMPPER